MTKLVGEYTIDELLAASEEKPITRNKLARPSISAINGIHIDDAIKRIPFAHGKVKIPTKLVYDRYLVWCEEVGQRPLKKLIFLKHFKKYFPVKRIVDVLVYELDPYPFGLSEAYSFYRDPRFVKVKYGFGPVAGFKGVHLAIGWYIARIKDEHGFSHFLGQFNTPEEAAQRYDIEMVNYYGKEEAYENLNYKEKAEAYEASLKANQKA